MPLAISRKLGEKTFLEVAPSTESTLIEMQINRILPNRVGISFLAPQSVAIDRDAPRSEMESGKVGRSSD